MYSLWLVPERNTEVYSFLDQLIHDIAVKYRTPVFNPHTTLLDGIKGEEQDARERTQLLAEKLSPFEIKLGEIGSHGTYFQILFSKIDPTHSVLNANALARKVFGMDKGDYFPHLSLVYGDLSENQFTALKKFVVQKCAIAGMHFIAQSIELWHTNSAAEEWYQVETFPLRKT